MPLHWLGAGPQAAYNVVFLLMFPLSAIGAYLLTLELTKRHDAAFIAGLLFGFAPYRIAHLPQIQSLASFPAPFALLGLHRYLARAPAAKWLRAVCDGLAAAGSLQWLLPAVLQRFLGSVDSVVREPVAAAAALYERSALRGRWRRFQCCRCCCLTGPFTRLSASRATSRRFSNFRPTSRRCSMRPDHLAVWGWLRCFAGPKESCSLVSRSFCLLRPVRPAACSTYQRAVNKWAVARIRS